MTAASASSPVLLRRPNGRMQACDPCRSRKVACDHHQPVCKRCISRGQEAECVYTSSAPRKGPLSKQSSSRHSSHPAGGATPYSRPHVDASAPRTAGRGPIHRPGSAEDYRSLRRTEFRRQPNTEIHGSPEEKSPPGPSHIAHSLESPADHPGRRRQSTNHELSSATTTPGSRLLSDRASTPVDQASGYLGFTSHSSVLEETQNSLSMLQGFQGFRALLPPPTNNGLKQSVEELRCHCSPTMEMCLVVLRGIPAANVSHTESNDDSPFYRDGWLRAIGQRVLSDLHEMFGSYFGPCRVDSQLEEIAHFLSENTSKPFQEDEPDSKKWISQFTGSNLRWESLGLLFSFVYFLDVSPLPHGGYGTTAKREWTEISRICLGLCIDLSRRFSSANSLLAQLYMRRSTLESIHAGDASKWMPYIMTYDSEALRYTVK
jgi:hypothetical protein